jgi:uncharacterized protein
VILDTLPSWQQFAWALAIIPVAAYLHGLLGLGFVTVAMPLLVLVLDLRLVMVLTVPAALALSAQLTFMGGNLRQSLGRLWVLPVCMVMGAFSGAWIFQHADPRILTIGIAAAIALFLSVDYFKKADVHLPPSWVLPAAMFFGFLAGNTETAVNMGAPFLLIFCLIAGLSPMAMVQTINLCFFSGKVIHAWTLSVGGPAYAAVMPVEWIPGILIAPLCIWLCRRGARKREKTDVETYRRWLKNFMKLMVVLVLAKVATL